MKKYRYVLFDLDGTLTESAPGIINSVRYTAERYGVECPDGKTLRKFIGPPLIDSFMRYFGFSQDRAEEAVDVYREYFSERGLFENTVYGGVKECLDELKRAGFTLAVATSKPEVFCRRILEHFELSEYFDVICGIPLDGENMTKSEVIARALLELNAAPSDAVMIGDRDYDVIGARENTVDCIGVLYGYGSREELIRAGAVYLAETPGSIAEMLITR